MKREFLAAGLPGVDTSQTLDQSKIDGLWTAGKRFVLQCIGLPNVHEDVTPGILDALVRRGFFVALYCFYRSKDWNASTGASDAAFHLNRVPANYPRGCVLFCDLEGGFTSLPDLLAYIIAWIRAIKQDGRWSPGLYLGKMALSPEQIMGAIGPGVYLYHSGMEGTPEGDLVYHIRQDLAVPGKTMNVVIGGATVDTDTSLVAGLPVASPDVGVAPAVPIGDPLQALRAGQPGDTPGAKIWRAITAFAGASLSTHQEKLVALAGVDNPANAMAYAREQTNCATTMRWILALVGCPSKWVTQPDQPGVSMGWDLLAAQEYGALIPLAEGLYPTGSSVPADPNAWRMCDAGWGLHYGIPGSNDDHVEWCGGRPDPQTGVAPHAGGGRADNAITLESGDIRWSYSRNRKLLHVIDPNRMRIPTLPALPQAPAPAAPATTEPTPPPEMINEGTKANGQVRASYTPLILAVWAVVLATGGLIWRACGH